MWSSMRESPPVGVVGVEFLLEVSPETEAGGVWSSGGESLPVGVEWVLLGGSLGVERAEVISSKTAYTGPLEGLWSLLGVGTGGVWPFKGESPPAGHARLAEGGVVLLIFA